MRKSFLFTIMLAVGGLLLAQSQNPPQSPTMGQPPGTMTRPQGRMDPGATPGYGRDQIPQATNKIDSKRFIKDTLQDGMTEVEISKTAADKASNDGVKQFAQKMVTDHSKVNEELKQIATKEKVPVEDNLDSKHQSRVDKLSKLSGADFDRAFLKELAKDHQNAVREFQMAAENANDPDLKAFASKNLPALEEHLRMIKDLEKTKKTTASK